MPTSLESILETTDIATFHSPLYYFDYFDFKDSDKFFKKRHTVRLERKFNPDNKRIGIILAEVSANSLVDLHHWILASEKCKRQNLKLPLLLFSLTQVFTMHTLHNGVTTIDKNYAKEKTIIKDAICSFVKIEIFNMGNPFENVKSKLTILLEG